MAATLAAAAAGGESEADGDVMDGEEEPIAARLAALPVEEARSSRWRVWGCILADESCTTITATAEADIRSCYMLYCRRTRTPVSLCMPTLIVLAIAEDRTRRQEWASCRMREAVLM